MSELAAPLPAAAAPSSAAPAEEHGVHSDTTKHALQCVRASIPSPVCNLTSSAQCVVRSVAASSLEAVHGRLLSFPLYLLIKRLVLERILYSKVGSLQQRYQDVFGSEVRTEQLEVHVF